jgi:hypothetical protein
VGSKPPALGEDALLQPVAARLFGVGERDTRVTWCSNAQGISGEGRGLSANFTLYRQDELRVCHLQNLELRIQPNVQTTHQPIDREVICKLFNALCVAKINCKCIYVYHYVAI